MTRSESHASLIDSSALLAAIYDENGKEEANQYFDNSYMSVINAAECLIVLTQNGMPQEIAKKLLESIISKFIPCEYNDAELISEVKCNNKDLGLSIADFTCIALGNKLGLKIITADKSWKEISTKTKIICIR